MDQTQDKANAPDATGHDEHHGHHDPYLAHHFETKKQQFMSAKLGMWVFLATEILMFGGLFVAYGVYHESHPAVFHIGSRYLDWELGAINTVVLLCSSFTMAWAVRAAQKTQDKRNRKGRQLTAILLGITLLGGVGFMGIKAVEYSHKFHLGLAPGKYYQPAHEIVSDAKDPVPPEDAHYPQHTKKQFADARVFFSIYFGLTGLHGLHVLIGMGLITWIFVRTLRGEFFKGYYIPVDLVGLYWHLVDLIWIYLFPLLYLVEGPGGGH